MNYKPQHYFQISLTGNVFAVPTARVLSRSHRLYETYETGWGRGWYRENVSGKRNLKVVLRFKIHLFDLYHYVWIYIIIKNITLI